MVPKSALADEGRAGSLPWEFLNCAGGGVREGADGDSFLGGVSMRASVVSSLPGIFWWVINARCSGLNPDSRAVGGGPGGCGACRLPDRTLWRDCDSLGSPFRARSLLRHVGIAEWDLEWQGQFDHSWLRYIFLLYSIDPCWTTLKFTFNGCEYQKIICFCNNFRTIANEKNWRNTIAAGKADSASLY